MKEVKIKGVSMSGVAWVVLLGAKGDKRTLPIAIGAAEAQAILFEMNSVPFPRPLTHDLFRNVLEALGTRLEKVVISELRDDTFFAVLHLSGGAGEVTIDARPSDALALALRFRAPVYVVDAVMDGAGLVLGKEGEANEVHAAKAEASPVQRLREALAKAVSEERYEDAARLRDRLNALGSASQRKAAEAEPEPEG